MVLFQKTWGPFFEKYQNKLRYLIGDIRDKDRLNFAIENVDYVVHAAALKQVPALEYNPFEAVKTKKHPNIYIHLSYAIKYTD